MGHHGTEAPFNQENMDEFMKKFEGKIPQVDKLEQLGLGPTNKFPMGHLNKDDEGEIRIGITSHGGKIVIDFGKPIHWIGFSPDQAKDIAQNLIDRANEIILSGK